MSTPATFEEWWSLQDTNGITERDLADAWKAGQAALAVPASTEEPDAPIMCCTADHDDVPASTVGTYDDGDYRNDSTAYCADCTKAMEGGEYTVTRTLVPTTAEVPDDLDIMAHFLEKAIKAANGGSGTFTLRVDVVDGDARASEVFTPATAPADRPGGIMSGEFHGIDAQHANVDARPNWARAGLLACEPEVGEPVGFPPNPSSTNGDAP